MSFLKVEGLKKRFDDVQVLNGVSFTANKKEIIVVLGPSGVGKTTLLRCLNFLELADEGTISIEDKIVFDATKKASTKQSKDNQLKLGLVFQSFNLFPQYTVLENMMLAVRLVKKKDKDVIKSEALDILKSLDLLEKADSYPYSLSGGQKQRAAIARALILKPEIICFDEPTSALDPSLREEVSNVILNLKSNNQTIFIVTHDLELTKKIADRILIINDGIIEKNLTKEEYFS